VSIPRLSKGRDGLSACALMPCLHARQSKLSSEELRLLRATDLIGQKETMKQKLKRCACALLLSAV
jgi:hypothetical protein